MTRVVLEIAACSEDALAALDNFEADLGQGRVALAALHEIDAEVFFQIAGSAWRAPAG